MISPDVAEYVREQLRAGYTPSEIRAALLDQGWSAEEVEESLEGQKPAVYPPVEINKGRNGAFIISLLGGVLIFMAGLESVLSFQPITSALAQAGILIEITGFLGILLPDPLAAGAVALLFAILAVTGSFLITNEERRRLGSVAVLVFSLLALLGFSGFLFFLGGVLGIVGSVLGFREG